MEGTISFLKLARTWIVHGVTDGTLRSYLGTIADSSSLFYVTRTRLVGCHAMGFAMHLTSPNLRMPAMVFFLLAEEPLTPKDTHMDCMIQEQLGIFPPYRDMFENFVEHPPKGFNTANQQKFDAIGQGRWLLRYRWHGCLEVDSN